MKVAIITGYCLATTHGTGAQILRIFGGQGIPFFHLYWSAKEADVREYDASFLMDDWQFPYYRGRRTFDRLRRKIGASWWRNNRVHASKLKHLLTSNDLHYDVAYVVVANEAEALRANSLLEILNCPYVVHLMDLQHDDGLSTRDMPGYSQLLGEASKVLALNEALAAEVRKFRKTDVFVVAFGQDTTPLAKKTTIPGEELRILMSGALHPVGMDLLIQAWPRMKARYPNLRIVYTGAYSQAIPVNLESILDNKGYLDKQDYQNVLQTSHLAYLTGPSTHDSLARYSIPSRLSDFLMNGLPILACFAPGSIAEKFVMPLIPDCVHMTRTPEQILDGLNDYLSSQDRWYRASNTARSFAEANLSIDKVRRDVVDALMKSC